MTHRKASFDLLLIEIRHADVAHLAFLHPLLCRGAAHPLRGARGAAAARRHTAGVQRRIGLGIMERLACVAKYVRPIDELHGQIGSRDEATKAPKRALPSSRGKGVSIAEQTPGDGERGRTGWRNGERRRRSAHWVTRDGLVESPPERYAAVQVQRGHR